MSISSTALQDALEYHQLGRLDLAEQIYLQILEREPKNAQAWHLLGVVAHQAGRIDRATDYINRAVTLDPNDPIKLANLGEVYRAAGRFEDARLTLERALALAPKYAEAHYKHGLALRDLGRGQDAIAAYCKAIEFDSFHASAYNNLGCQLHADGRLIEAVQCFHEALRRQPNMAIANNNLGAALSSLELATDAAEAFRRALKIDPKFVEAQSNLLFTLNYDPAWTQEQLFAEHVRWDAMLPAYPRSEFPNPPQPERPLRVGYVSRDFFRHPIAYFLGPILANHDRAHCEAFCYCDRALEDDLTVRLKQRAAQWRSIVGLADDAVVQRIREDRIDILVDLAGHTSFNRLQVFARRAAPVQVTYLGYPNTTGMAAMDYRLTTDVADPPDEPQLHSEQLVRLPGTFCCYEPPLDAPPVSPLPATEQGHITFGSLHNLSKLNDATLDLWRAVLERVPGSRLLVVRHTITPNVKTWLEGLFAERNLKNRVELLGELPNGQSHLALYDRIDLALDAIPWSGHTTACESLWMGVPMVTLRGNRHAGRMVASVLECLGHAEWIAESPHEFVEIAAGLAGDLAPLARIRAGLREAIERSPLCDGQKFTRSLEKAYRQMWHTWCDERKRAT